MSFRGVLIVVALIIGLLFYTGKAQEWWASMTHAAQQVHATPTEDGQ
ncbi:MAG TPA: hypothetical protein VK688_06745 [Gemmatimonadales bacterium]|jgi:hypothetical protein|nr:hypothetical protein [Gemmatimonadales bacterium]